MNESITRAAGAEHGEELPPDAMEKLIAEPRPHLPHPHHALRRRRPERHDAAHAAKALEPIQLEVAERWTGSLPRATSAASCPSREPSPALAKTCHAGGAALVWIAVWRWLGS